MTESVAGTAKSTDVTPRSRNLGQISALLDTLAHQFETLDVQTQQMEGTGCGATTLTPAQNQADLLLNKRQAKPALISTGNYHRVRQDLPAPCRLHGAGRTVTGTCSSVSGRTGAFVHSPCFRNISCVHMDEVHPIHTKNTVYYRMPEHCVAHLLCHAVPSSTLRNSTEFLP